LRPTHALVAALLVLLALALAPAAHADGPNKAGLIVVYPDQAPFTACVTFTEAQLPGIELLRRAGLRVTAWQSPGTGEAVCKIEGVGCDFPGEDCFCACMGTPCIYWSYWYWSGSAWIYSGKGASNRAVTNGGIDAWVWGDAETGPPDIDWNTICPPPTATATTVPTATEPPAPSVTPTDAPPPPSSDERGPVPTSTKTTTMIATATPSRTPTITRTPTVTPTGTTTPSGPTATPTSSDYPWPTASGPTATYDPYWAYPSPGATATRTLVPTWTLQPSLATLRPGEPTHTMTLLLTPTSTPTGGELYPLPAPESPQDARTSDQPGTEGYPVPQAAALVEPKAAEAQPAQDPATERQEAAPPPQPQAQAAEAAQPAGPTPDRVAMLIGTSSANRRTTPAPTKGQSGARDYGALVFLGAGLTIALGYGIAARRQRARRRHEVDSGGRTDW
jgi:hypothetical protein